MATPEQIRAVIKDWEPEKIAQLKALDPSKQQIAFQRISVAIDGTGLPKDVQKTSIDINARPDMLGQAVSEFKSKPMSSYSNASELAGSALKGMSGLYQRAEAGISNPITGMQKGIVKNPQDAFNEFKAGITGSKLGEYGDIARNAGLSEPVSATLGLGASMALDPIAGLSSKPAQAFGRFLNDGTKNLGGRVMNAVLNTPTKFLERGQDLGIQALERDIVGSYKTMLKKISGNLKKTDGAIDSFLSGRSETVDAFDIAQSLDKVFQTRTLGGDIPGAKNVKYVQNLILQLADPKTGKIGVGKANEFKIALNKLVGEGGFFSKSPAALTEARRIASGKTADSIEKATANLIEPRTGKTVAEINKEVGSNLNIGKAIRKVSADRGNNPLLTTLDVVSTLNPGIAAANISRRALASSSIGSRVAKGLYESGKSGFSGILGRIAVASLAEASRKANGLKSKR